MSGRKHSVGEIVWCGPMPYGLITREGKGTPVKARIIRAKEEWQSYDVVIIGKEDDGPVPALDTEVRSLNALERLAEET